MCKGIVINVWTPCLVYFRPPKMKQLILIFCVFGTAFSQVNRQLINGLDAPINSYPYMAGILTNSVFTCGGAIINFRSILTAAHCILSHPQDITVSVGGSRLNGQDGSQLRVSHTFMHPDYRGIHNAIVADIAVIRTLFPITFTTRVRPISLGSSIPVSANERVTITGWGLTGTHEDSDLAQSLQSLEMSTISNNLCASLHQNTMARGWITSEKICTVGIQNNQQRNSGICAGDSGGPLVVRNTVIGVASWTIRPCGSYPSVFIRTSNHLRWIRDNL